MTTIAYKAGHMSCDSCWTYGHVQTVSQVKITRLSSGALLGQAGDNDARAIEEILDRVKKPSMLPSREALQNTKVDFYGLLVLPGERIFHIATARTDDQGWVKEDEDDAGVWEGNRNIAAAGSGSLLALGAMDAGVSAAVAVRIACRWDINSRLPVHTLSLITPPKKILTRKPK
jgi:hypothetical protein